MVSLAAWALVVLASARGASADLAPRDRVDAKRVGSPRGAAAHGAKRTTSTRGSAPSRQRAAEAAEAVESSSSSAAAAVVVARAPVSLSLPRGGAWRGGVRSPLVAVVVPWRWSTELQLKAISLVALAVQNSLLTMTMRYSRTRKSSGPRFLPSEAVVMSELVKTVVSIILATRAQRSFLKAVADTYGEAGSYVLALPAAMYVVQNNLQYVAASNLEPAIFQLLYQMKLLTTAFFSVVMLGRRLKPQQWSAIALLAAGLSGVGMSNGRDKPVAPSANFPVGFSAVFAACCTSGFSSVFFERVVKVRRKTEVRKVSVWSRNAQLASFSCIIAIVGAYIKDGDRIRKRGILAGFTPLVWCVVALQAGGGLCTAAVIAYADNLLKGFATGVSMLLSVLASCIWLDFEITRPFLAGAASVVGAILLYALT